MVDSPQSESIYSFDRARNDFPLDPNTLNLSELTMTLAMKGWMVSVVRRGEEEVDFTMRSMGGDGSRSADVLAEELGLRDDEGEVLEGYMITGAGSELTFSYTGKPDLKFADVVHRLYELE